MLYNDMLLQAIKDAAAGKHVWIIAADKDSTHFRTEDCLKLTQVGHEVTRDGTKLTFGGGGAIHVRSSAAKPAWETLGVSGYVALEAGPYVKGYEMTEWSYIGFGLGGAPFNGTTPCPACPACQGTGHL